MKHVAEYIAGAEASVDSVTAAPLAADVEAGDVVVVDVREDRERWSQGTIPGTVHASRGGIEYAADPESEYYVDAFDPDGRYVCHCSGGTRGALAAARLREMGYRDVAYLEDGFAAWEAAG
ncbi:MAG TPA: rhodanese-like domain-containing protein [Halobacteriales archaeon]|nr:rhodanese-like domain-containing protein [Halobacteriales archaeon]